jgi:colanic acid biosynthesis glycosyl transferase WcaI
LKKVLIVSQHFPPENSGNASRIHDIAVHLADMGMQVTVLAPHPTFPTGSFPRNWHLLTNRLEKQVKLVNLWTWQPGSRNPGFISRMLYYLVFPLHAALWMTIHGRCQDLIITSAPPLFTHIPGLLIRKVFRTHWIMDIRDLWIDASISLGFIQRESLFERMARKFEAICLEQADLIAVTTKEIGRRISPQEEIRRKVFLLPNGVDTITFQPEDVPKQGQIIYAGNVGHAQDLEQVVLSLREVNAIRPLTLNIVGGGDIAEHLREFVTREGLEEYVIFSGPVDRDAIPRILSASLIGIAPLKKMESLEYAAPTKVYEYMACGVPFLGCGNGEITTLAHESGAGIIADNTPHSIASAILSLLSDPERMTSMGASGREYVSMNYDRRAIAATLKDHIEWIACTPV